MRIDLYGKKFCAGCNSSKRNIEEYLKISKEKVDFYYHDMDEVEGMVEGANANVGQVPTTILSVGSEENQDASSVLRRWDGDVPNMTEVDALIRDGVCNEISY